MTSAQTIPTVDLAAFLQGDDEERHEIATSVDATCRTIGFLIVDKHGVPQQICDDAWSLARAFFDLPLEDKMPVKSSDPGCPRGYFPFAGESLARTRGVDAPPDRKESFSSGPLAPPVGHEWSEDFEFFYGSNIWPTVPAEFQRAWIEYYRAMERLGSEIMQLLAMALGLDANFFAACHQHHLSALRALNYPASEADSIAGQHRAGAHSDYGSVTILKPDPQVAGLEIQLPSGEWLAAPVVTDSFIVNIGDLMARWTNDRWISTLHRVGSAEDAALRRQSIAYFMNPGYDAEIGAITTCIADGERAKYEAVRAGEYLIAQFRSAN